MFNRSSGDACCSAEEHSSCEQETTHMLLTVAALPSHWQTNATAVYEERYNVLTAVPDIF